MTPAEQDQAILNAHAAGDKPTLIRLYAQAGDARAASDDLNAAAFFWTYAYIYALETGAPEAKRLHARLKEHGREA